MSDFSVYVPAKGMFGAKIAIVGEGPSYEEVSALEPFVGPSGKFLTRLLLEANIERSSCWITNVSKYMAPPSPRDKKIPFWTRARSVGIDKDKCIAELRTELQQIKPNVIIALGGTALEALTGKNKIMDWRGSILNGMGFKVIPTYHPAHILHGEGEVKGYYNRQVMLFDLLRAKKESFSPGFESLPKRMLHVARSSHELYDFIQRNKNNRFPSADIEAINCIPVCLGISYNPNEGITIPLWNVDGISTLPDSEIINCWSLLSNLLANNDVVGANFGYDRDKIKRLGFIIRSLKSDTMLKAFCINPELPKNLAFNTSIYTNEPFYKNEGMYDGSLDDLFIGCARDACCTKEVDLAMDTDIDTMGLRKYYENFILPLHSVYHFRNDDTAIEQVGFRCDESIRAALLEKYIQWDEDVRYKLFKITGEYVNTSSPKQVSKLLYEDWKCPVGSGTGEEAITSILNSPQVKNPLHREGMELILEDRRVKKTITSYLYSPTDYDGRMRTSYFLCLETGRSATQQQEAPIRPTLVYDGYEDGKKVKKRQALGMAFQTITKHGEIGPDIRTMLCVDLPDSNAEEGYIFLQADSSQAEARVIFLLAEDYIALEAIDKHDYHALTASWFFGGKEEDYSKRTLGYESPIRFAGKTLRHAGHLGASKRRASIEVNTQARKFKIDYRISESEAGRALTIFHKKQPKIKEVFQNGVIKALEKNRRLTAPVPYGIDADKGGTRIFFERWGDELFRQAFSYLPQRTVSENTKRAALAIRGNPDRNIIGRAEWIKILCESHDSLLCQVPIKHANEAALILKEELEKPIDFSGCSLPRGELIIPCEIESGYNYKELSKFKWL